MFLKRLEIHGFKSFADKINIEFQQGITGIVGPNGCGKSNITDAIKWVLGEQSVKSLRGSSMVDVIFAGSQDRKPQNLAEVTLVFDNSDHQLNLEYNEIEITRRIYRQNNETEYLLNKKNCRLKDITDLLMDTGLGKDSLSIISQGNISSFAENKPIERRGIFEEAAGVSKYKKRKIEAIRKLEKTSENLERLGDIVNELEKQIAPLKRQKDKAEKYLNLKENLTEIEVSLLVEELKVNKAKIDELKDIIKKYQIEETQLDSLININEHNNDEVKNKMFILDNEINELQTKYLEFVDQVSKLESTKQATDASYQRILENNNEDISEKINILKKLITDTVNEYNNRVVRYKQSSDEIESLRNQEISIRKEIEEVKENINLKSINLSKYRSNRELLVDQIENNNHYSRGVRTIMNNLASNDGVVGVVEELFNYEEKYSYAINIALGGSNQSIITKDDYSARKAISFLKNNHSGRATFLPLNVMQGRSIRQEHLILCQSLPGYLGVASDFVTSDLKIGNVILNLLGNVIVADNLENANNISKATFNRYRIVTLGGDVVNVGGSLTGGSTNKPQSLSFKKQELEKINELIKNEEKDLISFRVSLNKLENTIREFNNEVFQKQMTLGRIEAGVQSKKDSLMKLKAEYETLTNKNIELSEFKSNNENKILDQLNEAIYQRDSINEQIKAKRTLRMNYLNNSNELELKLKQYRSEYREINQKLNDANISLAKYETLINNYLARLNEEYQMTFEHASKEYKLLLDINEARNKVKQLRTEIDSLGNINLDSIEEYKEVSLRYETLDKQRIDLIQAQDTILKAIKDMDRIMIEKFSSTFEKINVEFNKVFRTLFGGGSAHIVYSDPENILETGIDIDVQPPGKSVQNISLFSGGEKALIAISCLFAILQVNPVPMVILDEVEAALDLANVERFAHYLKEFSNKTQFIVVTHREGTMEECDLLYGATMQQKGVTKLVSVKLEDALDLNQTN